MMRKFTSDEIADIQVSYRDAKEPDRQIGILSELYAAGKDEIRAVLGLGEPAAPVLGRTRRPKSRHSAEFVAQVASDVLERGMTNSAAARKHGVAVPTVCTWVRKERERREDLQAGESASPAVSAPPVPGPAAGPAPAGQAADTDMPAPYFVYRKNRMSAGWQKAVETAFTSIEAASRWATEKALSSELCLAEMMIVREYPILPVWEDALRKEGH